MKRMTVIFFVAILVCTFLGMDLVIARTHRDAPLGGFSLWQIAVGIICLIAFLSGMAGVSKESVEKQKKENKERVDREKAKKGLFKYYGEGIGYMLLYWAAPFILVGMIWSCDQIFK
jgi:hypothetical protein